MALSDHFVPVPDINCPLCGHALTNWTGRHSGHCCFFVWTQHSAAPVGQQVDPEWRLSEFELARLRLAGTFWFFGGGCRCGYEFPAHRPIEGIVSDGVWRDIRPDSAFLRLKDVGDGYLQCPDCCDVVEQQANWRLYRCPTCDAERWYEPNQA